MPSRFAEPARERLRLRPVVHRAVRREALPHREEVRDRTVERRPLFHLVPQLGEQLRHAHDGRFVLRVGLDERALRDEPDAQPLLVPARELLERLGVSGAQCGLPTVTPAITSSIAAASSTDCVSGPHV